MDFKGNKGCNTLKDKCPSGWNMPNLAQAQELLNTFTSPADAFKYLKDTLKYTVGKYYLTTEKTFHTYGGSYNAWIFKAILMDGNQGTA